MTKKYVIREPHYLFGKYHHATNEFPAVVELPDDMTPSKAMTPHGEGEPAGIKLKGHYNDGPKEHVMSAAKRFDEPLPAPVEPEAPEAQPVEPIGKKGKRPSDKDV